MTPPESLGELAIVGRVRKAHGLHGELVVEAFTDEPAAVFAAGRRLFGGTPEGRVLTTLPGGRGEPRTLTVRRASTFKGGWIVALDEIADRDAADQWRARTLLAPYDELPPAADDEVYYHELVGMRVRLADGTDVGEVVDLFELPQGLALDVRRDGRADTVLVPYLPAIVVEVDVPARTITLDPPDGLLE